jgi:hypothetical protein
MQVTDLLIMCCKALPCLAFSERRDFFGHLLYSFCVCAGMQSES